MRSIENLEDHEIQWIAELLENEVEGTEEAIKDGNEDLEPYLKSIRKLAEHVLAVANA